MIIWFFEIPDTVWLIILRFGGGQEALTRPVPTYLHRRCYGRHSLKVWYTKDHFNSLQAEEGRHTHVHTFKNISCEPTDYSTKCTLTVLSGVDYIFG